MSRTSPGRMGHLCRLTRDKRIKERVNEYVSVRMCVRDVICDNKQHMGQRVLQQNFFTIERVRRQDLFCSVLDMETKGWRLGYRKGKLDICQRNKDKEVEIRHQALLASRQTKEGPDTTAVRQGGRVSWRAARHNFPSNVAFSTECAWFASPYIRKLPK